MKKQALFILLNICNSIIASAPTDPARDTKTKTEQAGKPGEKSIPTCLSMEILPQESVLKQKNIPAAFVDVSFYKEDGILCKTDPKGVKINILARSGFSMRRENIYFDNSSRVEYETFFSDILVVPDAAKIVLTHASAAALTTLQNAQQMGGKIPKNSRWDYTSNGFVHLKKPVNS